MSTNQAAIVAAMSVKDYVISLLDADLKEEFEERAGIMQFSSKLTRDHAECLALIDVLRRHHLRVINIR